MLKDILKQKDYLPVLKMSDGTAVTKENWEERKNKVTGVLILLQLQLIKFTAISDSSGA